MAEYLSFAVQRTRKWSRLFPTKREDIEATALLALVKAFNKRVPDTDDERKKWLTTCIHNEIARFLVHDKLVYIPQEKVRDVVIDVILDKENILPQLKQSRPTHDDWLNFDDLVDQLDLNHRELQILHRIIEGYTFEETAKLVGLQSRSAVSKILKKIARKYAKTRISDAGSHP